MFRALTFPSSGGKIVFTQQSSLLSIGVLCSRLQRATIPDAA